MVHFLLGVQLGPIYSSPRFCEGFLHQVVENLLGPRGRLPQALNRSLVEFTVGQLGLSGAEVCRSLKVKLKLIVDFARARASRFRRSRGSC